MLPNMTPLLCMPHLVSYTLWMPYSCFRLFTIMSYSSLMSPCSVTQHVFACRIWFLTLCQCSSLNIIHSTICILWPFVQVSLYCYPAWLLYFACHIWFLDLCDCSSLLSIVLPSACLLWFSSCVAMGSYRRDIFSHLGLPFVYEFWCCPLCLNLCPSGVISDKNPPPI